MCPPEGSSTLDDQISPEDDGYAFIGAVHSLVTSGTDATKPDLILAAVAQALRSGDKSTGEIVSMVNSIWPGARLDEDAVRPAFDLGIELNLVQPQEGLADTPLWTLTRTGLEDVQRQEKFVDELRKRNALDLKTRVESGLAIEVTEEQAELWLERLVNALIKGIQSSQDAYFGRVDKVGGTKLVPQGIDQSRVFAELDDERVDERVRVALTAAAVAAFDPLEPFGNELVSLITTGCVLHSYVAGRDSATALGKLGEAGAQRALIDTPVLVDLIGPKRVSESVSVVIQAGLNAGWEVIVCDHSLEELETLMDREIPAVVAGFAKAHLAGVKEQWYASLVDGQLAAYCLESLQDGTYAKLEEMSQAASNIRTQLVELGVTVRPHGNETSVSQVEKFRASLAQEFSGDNTRPRSAVAVERDAHSMAVVWRRRQRQSGTRWPGGWIITPDRHVGPAYRRAVSRDRIPLTLSAARWGTLLAATVKPAEVVELAAAAATQLVEEAMFLLPARFPSDVALDMAKQLTEHSNGSDLDIRLAQLTLEDALDRGASATSMASEVLAARTKRDAAIATDGVAAARKAEATAVALAVRATDKAKNALTDAERERERTQALQGTNTELLQTIAWQKKQIKRASLSVGLTTLGVATGVVSVVVGAGLLVVSMAAVATVIFGIAGWRWSREADARAIGVLIGAAIEVAGIAGTVIAFIPN